MQDEALYKETKERINKTLDIINLYTLDEWILSSGRFALEK